MSESDETNPQEISQTEQEEMTLPQKLRVWAVNRELKQLDGRLLRQAADEIEMLRERVKTLQRENLALHEDAQFPTTMRSGGAPGR